MAQGKAFDKEKVIQALKPKFQLGCNLKKACEYAGIPYTTVHNWVMNDEALRIQIQAWQNEPNELARANWINKLNEGDFQASRDWISKKEKDEFSDRVENTGADGGAIEVNVNSEEIEKALDDVL